MSALVVALVAACAYAVFAHGASGLPEEPRLQIGLALVAVAASVGWLFSGSLRLRAPALVWVGVALLGAFAVWCAITLAWSVAPDRTWGYVNRSVAYTLVVVLAIAAASSAPRVIERIAWGWLAVALATALYALAGKVMPGAEILGVGFNHTAVASRLRAPLEYWNALALVMVLAVPIALRLATDDTRRERTRHVRPHRAVPPPARPRHDVLARRPRRVRRRARRRDAARPREAPRPRDHGRDDRRHDPGPRPRLQPARR